MRQHNRELLAAKASEYVPATQLCRNLTGELLEHPVARRMSVVVVDALEMVEIEHQQGAGNALAREAGHSRAALFHERPARERAGERIVAGGV